MTKSCSVIFTQKIKCDVSKRLTINGSVLKMEPKVKFLGMIFDSKLTWSQHANYIVDKCKSRLNLMRCLKVPIHYRAPNKQTNKQTIFSPTQRSLIHYRSVSELFCQTFTSNFFADRTVVDV